MSQVETESSRADQSAGDEPFVRAVAGELPGPIGALIATIVVIVSLGLFVWSLIATWAGTPHDGLPLFPMFVVGTVASLTAMYAHKTFSYVIALIGGAAWLWVCIAPLPAVLAMVLQAITVTIMIIGITIALEAVKYTTRPRF